MFIYYVQYLDFPQCPYLTDGFLPAGTLSSHGTHSFYKWKQIINEIQRRHEHLHSDNTYQQLHTQPLAGRLITLLRNKYRSDQTQ